LILEKKKKNPVVKVVIPMLFTATPPEKNVFLKLIKNTFRHIKNLKKISKLIKNQALQGYAFI
jgi:hypothetical protein